MTNTTPRPKQSPRCLADTAPGLPRFTFRLQDGTIVCGPVHGSGGIIATSNGIDRIRQAQKRAKEGRDPGIYEPEPGHVRCYPDYSAADSGEPVDVDLRTAEVVS